jgi:hypothetical protein
MNAPAAIVIAKMLLPETEKVNPDLNVPKDRIGSNILDAIANGASEGLRLAVNVAIMLVVFIAFVAAINYILDDWIVGARYSYADALYGTGGTGDQPGHRVGPLIAWRGVNRTGEQASIQHLTAFTLFQWHVSHPFRAGQVSSAGIPLFAIALQWDGEVWRPASRRD